MRTTTRALAATAFAAAALTAGAGASHAADRPPLTISVTPTADYQSIAVTVTPPEGAGPSADEFKTPPRWACTVLVTNAATGAQAQYPRDSSGRPFILSEQGTPLQARTLTIPAVADLPPGPKYRVGYSCEYSYAANGSEYGIGSQSDSVDVNLTKPVTPPPVKPGGLFNFGSS